MERAVIRMVDGADGQVIHKSTLDDAFDQQGEILPEPSVNHRTFRVPVSFLFEHPGGSQQFLFFEGASQKLHSDR